MEGVVQRSVCVLASSSDWLDTFASIFLVRFILCHAENVHLGLYQWGVQS